MPLSPEALVIYARLAAYRLVKPGEDLDELTRSLEPEIARQYAYDNIDEIVASAPPMTPVQAARIGALWWSVPDAPETANGPTSR